MTAKRRITLFHLALAFLLILLFGGSTPPECAKRMAEDITVLFAICQDPEP